MAGHDIAPPRTPADWRILRMLLPYVWEYRWRAALSFVLLLVAKGATVVVPLVLKHLVDSLAALQDLTAPARFVLAYGALRLVATLAREAQSVVFAEMNLGIVRAVSRRMLEHLHDLSLRFHLERQTGAVVRDIERGTGSVSSILSFLLFNIVPTLVEVALVTGILVTTYDGWFALATAVSFVTYAGYTLALTQWRARFRSAANAADSKANSQAVDSLLNYETVKYFGNERFELSRYDATLGDYTRAAQKSQASLAALNAGQGAIIAVGVTIIMGLAVRGVGRGTMTLGDLVAVNAFMLQLFAPLGFLGTIYSALRQAIVDMQRLFDLFALTPEVRDQRDARVLVPGAGAVRFEHVSFAYEAARPILRDVDLTIAPGQKVAVVGPSGAGKSTLARLLFRFYDVTAGRVLVDGHDVREVTQDSVRAAIAVVPQDTVLFNDTLLHNLTYGRLSATRDEVAQATRMADLERFIASLPKGLDTVVGERGLKLSGGEKQRVAIARAILKQPRILIFDEATSSLDSASERAILSAMREVSTHHTTLVIAHRLSTVVDADEIVVLDGGRVVERGPHSALVAAHGTYARLWRLQQEESAPKLAAGSV
jgi:ATP-binding cassette, subfamily B, heavy metal transporter